jgi:hypothetical protein
MNFLDLLVNAIPLLLLLGFIWYAVDTYLLIRYGGKLKRGFKIWSWPLTSDEQKFLTSLKQDIVKIEERGKWIKRKSVSFIAISNGEALIRYSNPSQSTSWPMVTYVDLMAPAPELEYRISAPGILLWLAMVSAPVRIFFTGGRIDSGLFLLAFFIVMIGVSTFMEVTGNRRFLARQIELDPIRNNLQRRL